MVVTAQGLAAGLLAQDGARRGGYTRYREFYDGAQWEQRQRRGERRLTLNYARTFVRKAVSYLFAEPAGQAIPLGERIGEAQRQAAEGVLRRVAAHNDLAQIDFDACVSAAIYGDGAQKVTWDAAAGLPRIRNVDVRGLYCWWAPDDVRTLVRVAQVYRVGSDIVSGGSVAVPLDGTSYGPTPGRLIVESWTASRWVVEDDGVVVRDGPNPYGAIPYLVWPNESVPGEFWGVSDLEDVMLPAGELNRRLTVLSQLLDYSGWPVVVLEGVEGSSDLSYQQGAKWEIPEGAKAYLLDLLSGGGVEMHIKAIEALYKTLHDVAETPRTAFGDGEGGLSGVALETLLQPLIQKVKRKRAILDGVYRRRNDLVFALMERAGVGVGRWRTETVWGPITPRDRPQLVRDETALVASQIHSRQRASELLGDDDPAAELRMVMAEARQLSELRQQEAAAAASARGGGDGG